MSKADVDRCYGIKKILKISCYVAIDILHEFWKKIRKEQLWMTAVIESYII